MRRGSCAFSGVEWKTTLFQTLFRRSSSIERICRICFSFIQRRRTSVGNAQANARHKYNTFRIRSVSTRNLFQKIGLSIRQFRLSCLQRPLKRPVVTSPCCIVASKRFDHAKKSYKPAFDIDVHVDTLRRGRTIAQFADPEINRQTRKVIHHKLQISL